jgi:hypothetical protein
VAGHDLQDVDAALALNGLMLRGALLLSPGETAPPGPSGSPAKTVALVGQAGDAPWPHFAAWRAGQPAGLADPLDSWSRQVIGEVAARFSARAVSPSDKPYLPFQQWAMRAEGLKPSPLGILMHPEFGLWHAYRGALLFEADIAGAPPDTVIHLCDLCPGKPCLKACPVGAYSGQGFARQACLDHVRAPQGEPCRSAGCRDRNACPYGVAYRYRPEAQAFHMAAFMR